MIVYKFGGASVKDADGIRNLKEIVAAVKGNLVVVISAFGKTTNALEKVLKSWISGDERYKELLDEIYNYHLSVTKELFPTEDSGRNKLDISFSKLEEYLKESRRAGL